MARKTFPAYVGSVTLPKQVYLPVEYSSSLDFFMPASATTISSECVEYVVIGLGHVSQLQSLKTLWLASIMPTEAGHGQYASSSQVLGRCLQRFMSA